jgi:hypothetical protein
MLYHLTLSRVLYTTEIQDLTDVAFLVSYRSVEGGRGSHRVAWCVHFLRCLSYISAFESANPSLNNNNNNNNNNHNTINNNTNLVL